MDRTQLSPFLGITIRSILQDQSATGRREMLHRPFHGLILKLEGTTEYHHNGAVTLLSGGEVLYVKKDSSYFRSEITPGYSFVVNFDCASPLEETIAKLPMPHGFDTAPLAQRLYHAWQKENPYGACSVLYSLLEKSAAAGRQESYISPREKQHLEPVLAYLQQHLTDPELKLEQLPALAGISDAYLRRIFKKQYGIAPAGYVLHERMLLAKQLLTSGESQIAQVAAAVGYRDPLYFSRVFKKHLGVSPTEFCKNNRQTLF